MNPGTGCDIVVGTSSPRCRLRLPLRNSSKRRSLITIARTDPALVRFGLLWRIYDLVALKGIGFKPPIFEPLPVHYPCGPYFLGGVSGTDFLVSAEGLTQPKADRGSVYPGVTHTGGPVFEKTIRYKYKTLGVAERQCYFGYLRCRTVGMVLWCISKWVHQSVYSYSGGDNNKKEKEFQTLSLEFEYTYYQKMDVTLGHMRIAAPRG